LESLKGRYDDVIAEQGELRRRLAESSANLAACNAERMLPETKASLEKRIADLWKEVGALSSQRDQLVKDVKVAESTRSGLILSIERLGRLERVFANPDLDRRVMRLFQELDKGAQTISYARDGKAYLITNLILGTLRVSYDQEIGPSSSRPSVLTLEFEPHSVLSDETLGQFLPRDAVTKWFVEPDYSPTRIRANYDPGQSGRRGIKRPLNLRGNEKETWVWKVSSDRGFKSDLTDLIVYVSYETGSGGPPARDAWRQRVVVNEAPGALMRSWNWFVSHWVGLLATVIGIWASVVTIIVRGLEITLRKREIELRSLEMIARAKEAERARAVGGEVPRGWRSRWDALKRGLSRRE
jgi:hypothetical protein